ncbi:hypothetical protein [Vibrio diabolicus]|uniref:hypothetical protein n=1 Tax=Vibrio diabolicus TaxID=50719 RepID=UPI00293FDDE1|nr:hypothetical protein [Vibrio diabolicus]MDV5045218.1 hypothetical protein [Vibrio diabolicus]
MLKPSQIGLISAMCLFSSFAVAKGERYGLSASMLTIDSINYEEGNSGEQDTLRFGLVHSRPIDENNNRWRWWLGLNYLAEDIEAPASGLYQEVTNYELRVVPQYALASWSVFTPYVGAGLSAGYSQYSNRWQVDPEGYRYQSVEDIDQFELGAVIAVGTVIKLGSNPDAHIQIIPQASYILPVINDGIGGLELSVSMLF